MDVGEEETLAPSPRDRARPRMVQTRQSLGAVGRVASRVKTSGMSMIPTSILGWGKDDEQNASVSPWAAENTASARMEHTTPQAEAESEALKKKNTRSPRTQDSAAFASPVSNTSRQGTMEDVSRNIQRRRTGHFTALSRKSDMDKAAELNGQTLLKSSSNVVPRRRSTHKGRGETITRSTLDLREEKSGAGTFNPTSLMKGVSKLILRNGGGDADVKPTASSGEHMKQSVPGTSPVSDDLENDNQHQKTLKTSRLSRGFGLHKEKPKEDAEVSKKKMIVTPAKESRIAQSKSKAAIEVSKGLAKSISSAARAPLDLVSDKSTSANHQARGSKQHDGKHQVQFSASGKAKDKEVKNPKLRSSWFGFGREETSTDDSRKRGPTRVRGKSRLRTHINPSHAEKGTPSAEVKKKNPKGLDHVVDFAVDDYFDSEEDEIEAGGNVRSLAEDDFISYQTRHMRKGDRGRNR